MITEPRPHGPNACETGKTGGGILQAPAAFFGFIRKSADVGKTEPARRNTFADQAWMVTYERPNGDIVTEGVLINGGNLQADIEFLARNALKDQRDIDCAKILRLSMDFTLPPARLNALQAITKSYQTRMRYEAECG